jgi:hypothetical protein
MRIIDRDWGNLEARLLEEVGLLTSIVSDLKKLGIDRGHYSMILSL